MYAALWRLLPGPWWVRVFILLILLAGVLYGLFFHLYPWIAMTFVPDEVTVQ
ncbi:hypothetical protein [Microbacterium album]|uniref:DUF4175 domain-containing protein n=1 Tax=Microbacterium album TaxID=2053191 RepID=A0A917IGW6_9MICO|nr:hypothetical protein [Microbacterium album]GGH44510.1 hypothetical protein GCM10010921_19220 [Microbacterium album]